jgi:hypothetical protein
MCFHHLLASATLSRVTLIKACSLDRRGAHVLSCVLAQPIRKEKSCNLVLTRVVYDLQTATRINRLTFPGCHYRHRLDIRLYHAFTELRMSASHVHSSSKAPSNAPRLLHAMIGLFSCSWGSKCKTSLTVMSPTSMPKSSTRITRGLERDGKWGPGEKEKENPLRSKRGVHTPFS